MKERDVVFSPEAELDLQALYDWVEQAAGEQVASAYLDRLERYCLGFCTASERGQLREDIRPGLRVTGFERRINIAFFVDPDRVTILRLFAGGQNWEALLAEP